MNFGLKKRQRRALFVLIPSLCLLLIGFQNCNKEFTVTSSGIGSQSSSSDTSSTNNAAQGTILANLSGQTEPQYYFPLLANGSDIDLEFIYSSTLSPTPTEFLWNIVKPFPTGGNFQSTSRSFSEAYYTETFTEIGVYDISANGYETGSTVSLVQDSKTLVVGECENNTDILEITLDSGTLQPNTSAEFGVKLFNDEIQIGDIFWRIKFADQVITTGTASTQSVSWGNNLGGYLVEVFVKFDGDDCITHRRRIVDVTSSVATHINYVRPVDAGNVQLYNNYIYQYDRTSLTKSIFIDVENANKCQFDDVLVAGCTGEALNMNNIDLDTTQCVEETLVLTTFINADDTAGQAHQFYKYCPTSGSYCFFGPQEFKPSEHSCGDQTQTSFGVCDPNTCTGALCATSCINPAECNVKDVNGVCLPSCAYTAELAGFGGYGPDNIANTNDDPYIFVPGIQSCTGLTALEHNDWLDVPILTNIPGLPSSYQPHEVAEGQGVCCIRSLNYTPSIPSSSPSVSPSVVSSP